MNNFLSIFQSYSFWIIIITEISLKEVVKIKNLFKNKVFVTILIIILILVIGTFSFLFYKQIDSGNLKSNISDIKKIDKDLSKEESDKIKDSEYYPVENVYDILHRMSNTKIIVEDNQIWGQISAEPEYIASLKSLIEKIDYKDKDYMLEVLARWENNDFSQAVEERNYFWKKLGGTVGKAISLKNKKGDKSYIPSDLANSKSTSYKIYLLQN